MLCERSQHSFTDWSSASCDLQMFLFCTYQYFIHSRAAYKNKTSVPIQSEKLLKKLCMGGFFLHTVLHFNEACLSQPLFIFLLSINLISTYWKKLHGSLNLQLQQLLFVYMVLFEQCRHQSVFPVFSLLRLYSMSRCYCADYTQSPKLSAAS